MGGGSPGFYARRTFATIDCGDSPRRRPRRRPLVDAPVDASLRHPPGVLLTQGTPVDTAIETPSTLLLRRPSSTPTPLPDAAQSTPSSTPPLGTPWQQRIPVAAHIGEATTRPSWRGGSARRRAAWNTVASRTGAAARSVNGKGGSGSRRRCLGSGTQWVDVSRSSKWARAPTSTRREGESSSLSKEEPARLDSTPPHSHPHPPTAVSSNEVVTRSVARSEKVTISDLAGFACTSNFRVWGMRGLAGLRAPSRPRGHV